MRTDGDNIPLSACHIPMQSRFRHGNSCPSYSAQNRPPLEAAKYNNYDKAVIVTSDGDFACLVQYLDENNKLARIITPTNFYSSLFHPYTKYILPLSKFSSKISRK